MEAGSVLGCVSVAAAFGCGTAMACAGLGRRRSRRPGGAGAAGRIAVSGVRWARRPARVLLGSSRVAALADEAVRACGERGVSARAEGLTSAFVAFAAAVAALAGLASGSWVAAAAVAGCVCACTAARLGSLRDRRAEALREAVPDALRSMSACFQAGFSLLQTFHQVERETREPLRSLFTRAASRLETGGSADEALGELRRSSSPELAFVSVALDVQHQAGGSMRHVLDAARDTVEGELELRRALRVQTAQARLSARVVSVMPIALVAVFSLVSKGFLDPFFESAMGLCLLGVAVAMQLAGVIAVRRMLAVEVG